MLLILIDSRGRHIVENAFCDFQSVKCRYVLWHFMRYGNFESYGVIQLIFFPIFPNRIGALSVVNWDARVCIYIYISEELSFESSFEAVIFISYGSIRDIS